MIRISVRIVKSVYRIVRGTTFVILFVDESMIIHNDQMTIMY